LVIVVECFSESKLQIKGAGLKVRLPLYFYRTTVIPNKDIEHFIHTQFESLPGIVKKELKPREIQEFIITPEKSFQIH
jgi:hypothetical protein